MSSRLPIPRTVLFTLCALALLLAASCKESSSSPTSPAASATVTGTVIRGGGTSGATAQGMEIGLSGVTVTVVSTGQSAVTDASGNFTLTGVASGEVELEVKRADFKVKVKITVPAGSTITITISIVGSGAVVTPRGHAGEEIEGLVQSVNAPGSSLVVLDKRLGAVTVKADSTTLIRHGETAIPLSQIQVGMRVHVKAMLQADGTYLATEILLQDEKIGGEAEATGTVASVNTGDKSFVVTTVSGPITVKTDSSTKFKKKGSSAGFADVVTGAMVEAEGTLAADGSILARKVEIE
jgi:Domain of unknown function (DUF5666)/CarboxypepD_reg-like domain